MIYLHVGLPKVASTTIQRFLSRNAALLARHGYLYPALTEGPELGVSENAHNALAIELRRGRPGRVWQRLHEILDRRGPGEHLVLSGESFLGCGPGTLREALGGHPVTVLVYVRDFLRLIPSQYAHLTKQGLSTVDFDAYLARALTRPVCDLPGLARQWAGVFGVGRVRMRMLDPRALVGGDVQTDILDAMDLALDPALLDRVPPANAGLGWKTVEILRDLHGQLAREQALSVAGATGTTGAAERTEAQRLLRARKQREDSPLLDFGWALSIASDDISHEMGLSERGRYLSAEQIDRCTTAFNAQVRDLRAMGIDSTLMPVSAEGVVARDFLPSIAEIPPQEVADFLRRLMPLACHLLLTRGAGGATEAYAMVKERKAAAREAAKAVRRAEREAILAERRAQRDAARAAREAPPAGRRTGTGARTGARAATGPGTDTAD
jgi:hypothetical protein